MTYAHVIVRTACEADLGAMTDLYNYFVRETPISFDNGDELLGRRLV